MVWTAILIIKEKIEFILWDLKQLKVWESGYY